MSRPPILIKDFVKGNQVWKMLIRIVDLWVVKEISGLQQLKMVIRDKKLMVNDGTFKVCPNKLELVFNGGTTVSKMAISEIPPHQFKFKPIVDFLTRKLSNDLLYDAIGVLQDVCQDANGRWW
ncbi:unnamed protein product [Lathyrus oleraceus]